MFNNVEAIVKKGVDDKAFPGGHFCLIENGEIKCSYYGNKQLYPEVIPLKGDEIYDIASLSKIISTTTLIIKLIESKKLSYDTKVKDILPKYFNEETTILNLLNHNSGLNPLIKNANLVSSKEEVINQIYEERFVYEPETKIVYSDTGYMLLGFIAEKLYDMPINVAAEKYIFKPLEMNDTTYRPSKDRAVPTEFRDDKLYKGYAVGVVHDERAYLLSGLSGHAGLFSTAKDIAKFIKSFLEDERIFSNETKDLIFNTTYYSKDLSGDEIVRSIGYQKFITFKHTNDYVITHTGFTGCNMWIDKKNKRGFVLLSNGVHPNRKDNRVFPYRNEIFKLFYEN
ncbi:MAG TPA: beta-lactamase family protein [Acholeplasmataceae bacterium]|nr:beta-lactamase family protein [Acholeplasmataceae bacterium]